MTGRRDVLADGAARRAAQTEFTRPFALEAGAGTGKTATLVARIVAWCTGPGWEEAAAVGGDPEEIAARVLEGVVAITFTEAAAAEMAARVATVLAAVQVSVAESSDMPTGLLREALPTDGGELTDRAGLLLTQLERLRVSTIHAFARSILIRFPVEAGLRPGFEVDADGTLIRQLVETAVAETVFPAYADKASDALALAEKGLGPAEIGEAAQALAAAGLPSVELEQDPFSEEALEAMLGELAGVLGSSLDQLEAYAERGGGVKIKAAGKLLRNLFRVLQSSRGTVPAMELIQRAMTVLEAGDLDQALEKIKEWASGPTRNKPTPQDPGAFSKYMQEVLACVRVLTSYDPETFSRLRRVLGGVLGEVERAKRRQGIVAFDDLLRMTRELLETDGDVVTALRRETRQLLVDEMQDTDPDQARLVELMALEGQGRDRPCLFLVGDPKQSIYGFRRADFAAFEELVEHIRKSGGLVERLVVNFRSVPAVLDEVGRIVGPVMNEEAKVQAPFQRLLPCPEKEMDEGFHERKRRPVEHWISVPVDPETGALARSARVAAVAGLEAAAVAEDAAELHREHGVPWDEMAILMRSTTHVEPFLEALREREIPYEVGRDKSYYRTREVTEAGALVRLVLDSYDVQALLTMLRSPIAAVPDAALVPLWREGLPERVAAVDREDLDPELEAALRRAAVEVEREVVPRLPGRGLGELGAWVEGLLAFLKTLGGVRAAFRIRPPDLFVERLRTRTLIEPLAAARFPGQYRLANVDRFLRELEGRLLDEDGVAGVLEWLRRTARERPDEPSAKPRSAGGGVRVLTVHGAKGLGFDNVWLVQTAHSAGTRSRDGVDTRARRRRTGRWELLLSGRPTPGWYQALAEREAVEEAEHVRLLYVALTRAKRRLVTIGAPEFRKTHGGWTAGKGSFLQRLKRRDGGWPLDPEAVDSGVGARGTLVDDNGVQWRLLARSAGEPVQGGVAEAEDAETETRRLGADEAVLVELRSGAAVRQARPWLAGVSDEAHRRLALAVDAAREGAETPEEETVADSGPVPRDVATAVGTAVHRVLEHLDLGAADPDAELERRRGEVETWLAGAVADVAAARERLAGLLESLRSGPLWSRWLELKPHFLARELPVLLPPPAEDDGPVGALAGVLDLLYVDPETGAPVVVDYKTDDPQMIEERTAVYAEQLAFYAEAVRAALGLDEAPRTELWFLAAGEVITADRRQKT